VIRYINARGLVRITRESCDVVGKAAEPSQAELGEGLAGAAVSQCRNHSGTRGGIENRQRAKELKRLNNKFVRFEIGRRDS
jgi:hypothetical protein